MPATANLPFTVSIASVATPGAPFGPLKESFPFFTTKLASGIVCVTPPNATVTSVTLPASNGAKLPFTAKASVFFGLNATAAASIVRAYAPLGTTSAAMTSTNRRRDRR